jgi:hypothetical protein
MNLDHRAFAKLTSEIHSISVIKLKHQYSFTFAWSRDIFSPNIDFNDAIRVSSCFSEMLIEYMAYFFPP